jgi:hypothetical protein
MDVNFLQNIAALATVIGLPLLVLSIIVAYLPVWRARQVEKFLERSFGIDSFDPFQIKAAVNFYVDPDCSVLDPSCEDDIRQLVPNRTPLFATMDDFLSDKYEGKHVLILADSGMGKTSFLLNYYARNHKKRKIYRKRIAVIPLGRPNVEEKIRRIEHKNITVLLLDAFDEDTDAIRDHKRRLQQLMEVCADFKRVVLTCRTQFFASEEEIPKETGVAIITPRKAGQGHMYKFYKLYLAPFTDKQVRQYVKKRFPIWQVHKRKAALRIITAIPELSVRPMLLAVVPELLEAKRIATDLYGLYEFMVESWLERENNWIDKNVLRNFSEKLAVDIYHKRHFRKTERISRQELSNLIYVNLAEIERWKLTARSLLNRDAEGNYKFAHRSIMEYLYVTAFIHGRSDCLEKEWTDLMREIFISWASQMVRRQDSKVKTLLQQSDFSLTQLFPIFQKGRDPKNLLRNEILNPSVVRRARTQYSRINPHWSADFIFEGRKDETTFLYDIATDLLFTIPVDNRSATYETRLLFQLSAKDAFKEKDHNNWRAPTLDEFDLLYMINEEIPFADVEFQRKSPSSFKTIPQLVSE